MTDSVTVRERPTADSPTPAAPSRAASAILGEFKEVWDRGDSITAQDFLARRPDLAGDKDLVVDLAYEEFCRRLDHGQTLDPVEFAGRFPAYKSSLGKLLLVYQLMDEGLKAEAAEQAWPNLGDSFQGFTLLQELGRGSFARVYLAREEALGNRLVAIKISRAGLAEADILGRLAHDNIVPIHSVSHDPVSGLSVVCMPFLGKTTLLDVLDRAFEHDRPPRRTDPIVDAIHAGSTAIANRPSLAPGLAHESYVDGILHLGVNLADALAFVHAQSIFHRDLKPSNILLGPDGRAMLLDFNLSVHQDHGYQPLGGTIPYMSPEQLRMTDADYQGPPCVLDARSDLYSLGVILFEALTGQHPFGPIDPKPSELRPALLRRQADTPRRLTELNPYVDPEVECVIARCLAFSPDHRYPSADDLARDIRRCLTALGKVRRVCKRRPRLLRRSAAAALCLAAALVVVPTFREPYPDRQFRQGVNAFASKQFTSALGCFDEVLANKHDPQALLWRGRTQLRLGNIDAAFADLDSARTDLPDSGELWALLGYASQLAQPPRHDQAVGYYQKAITAGFKSATLYYNLGYAYRKEKGGMSSALECFQKAVALDPKFQPALRQLALLHLARAGGNQEALADALHAIDQAVVLGPTSADLFYDAARVYLEAARRRPGDARFRVAAIRHTCNALESGLPPAQIAKSPFFQSIVNEAPVQSALQVSWPPAPAASIPPVVDVLPSPRG